MDVDLRFKTELPAGGITVMLFAVYDVAISIDLNSTVTAAL